ncbi:MAG: hypothetical protein IKG58_03735 [Bacilli bacterium]|nr:hypothetical protein [Bacilli bacterium]
MEREYDAKILEVEEELKELKEPDVYLIDKKLQKLENSQSLIKKIIEFRAKNTLSIMNSEKEIDDDVLVTDLAIIKSLMDKDYNFDSMKMHLDYNPNTIEESVDLIGLLDKYEEEILKIKNTNYIINNDHINNYNVIEGIEKMKMTKHLQDDVSEIMEEEIDNKSKTI